MILSLNVLFPYAMHGTDFFGKLGDIQAPRATGRSEFKGALSDGPGALLGTIPWISHLL